MVSNNIKKSCDSQKTINQQYDEISLVKRKTTGRRPMTAPYNESHTTPRMQIPDRTITHEVEACISPAWYFALKKCSACGVVYFLLLDRRVMRKNSRHKRDTSKYININDGEIELTYRTAIKCGIGGTTFSRAITILDICGFITKTQRAREKKGGCINQFGFSEQWRDFDPESFPKELPKCSYHNGFKKGNKNGINRAS